MVVTLAAALSLASSLTIEVPFVPQTDALCGGAAAAMVFRYWGDAHADPQQFASLIERRRGVRGIADDVLVRAIESRGWRTEKVQQPDAGGDDLDALRSRLVARQPVIVLLADRGDRYHYVVVTGVADDAIVLHDPSWGPSRLVEVRRFTQLWNASGNWGLVVLPAQRAGALALRLTADSADPSGVSDAGDSGSPDPCDSSVARAVEEVQGRGLAHADEVLVPLRVRCSESPAFLRELAGLRFAQKRWRESETLARAVLTRVPHDSYTSELLGATLFMEDDPVGALRAWNAIRKPRLDRVQISGLTHSRYQAVVDAIGLRSGELLTPDAYVQAQHRLEELPDRSSSRLSLRPGEDGFASVDVAIAERSGLPQGYAAWTALGIRAPVERDVTVTLPGFTGQGDVWTVASRWWAKRPRVSISFAAPRVGGLPGIWRVDGSWEAETYAFGATPVRESRTHGGLTTSDWIGPHLRYSLSAGLDSWNTGRSAASIGGTLERRLLADSVAIETNAVTWVPFGSGELAAGFTSLGIRARAGTSFLPRRWAYEATIGATRVSDSAPLTIWSGAGDGHARPNLLRAHPLLDDGLIDAGPGSAFGRTLRYGNAEGQRWLTHPSVVRIAIASFVDIAQASRGASATDGPTQIDLGAGLRLRIPGAHGMLRVDWAHGLRDGANAITAGWMIK